MSRLFWLSAGVVVGAVVAHRVSRAARRYTPTGLAGQAQDLVVRARKEASRFRQDVRTAMAERERELLAAGQTGHQSQK